ncbi:MAG: hypothetical protein U0V48_02275 [Anaerolineales bacterium]
MDKAREVLKDEVVAVLGYGVQGLRAGAMNMRDNGIKVIVGQREDEELGQGGGRRLGSRRDVVLCGRSGGERNCRSVFVIGCGSALAVVEDR